MLRSWGVQTVMGSRCIGERGADSRTRTCDLARRLLYLLSYTGTALMTNP